MAKVTCRDLVWTDEGNGVFSTGLCATQLRIEGLGFDVSLPSGEHVFGNGATPEAAKQAAFDVFVDFAIKQLIAHKVALPVHAAA